MNRKGVINLACIELVTVAISAGGITTVSFLIQGKAPAPRLVANAIVLGLLFASMGVGFIWLAQKRRRVS